MTRDPVGWAGTWDGPFYRVRCDGFEVSFTPNAGESLDMVCNVDMWLTLADGSRWTGTVFTLAEVERLMRRWRDTGEALGGRYFGCPDGLIVRDAGVEAIVDVVEHLVAEGEYSSVFQPIPDDDTSAGGDSLRKPACDRRGRYEPARADRPDQALGPAMPESGI